MRPYDLDARHTNAENPGQPFQGLRVRDRMTWLGPTALLAVLAIFFLLGLFWPLASTLRDALCEPPVREAWKVTGKAAADSIDVFATRVGTTPERLRALNAEETLKPGQLVVVKPARWTLEYMTGLFAPHAPQWRWLLNSLTLAIIVTALCAAVSYPLAYWQARYTFPGRGVLSGLLLVPLILPPFVGAIGLRRMLARYGPINLALQEIGLVDPSNPIDFLGEHRFVGCVLVMALHLYPLLYLNLTAAISNIDPSLLESARNLGHTPWNVFRRVVLPLSTPGLIAGGSLVFIGAFTDLGTPLVFSYQEVIANQIYSLANEQTANPAGPALVAMVTAVVLTLFLLTRWALTRYSASGGVKGITRAAPQSLRGVWPAVVIGIHLVVILLALLPHLSVFLGGLAERWVMSIWPQSFTSEHLQEALLHPVARAGVRNSLIYAAGSTLIDVLLGLGCAWVIVRRGGWLGRAVDVLTIAPLAIPGLVLAFGYVGVYSAFYQGEGSGVLSFLGIEKAALPVSFFLVLAYAVRRLPYTTRACVAGLEQTPRALEEAAAGLGARPWNVIRNITVPLIAANVAAGAILAYAFALLEVSESLILANRPADYPLTKSIYHLFNRVGDGDQVASALGLLALGFMTLALLAAGAFLGRKWGEMFRG